MSVVELADLLVGLAFLGLAAAAWPRARPLALVAVAVALTWWLGSVWVAAALWHRGPLVHLLLAYPSGWPRSTWVRLVVVAGYAAALWPGAWSDGRVAVALSVLLVVARVTRSLGRRGRAAARHLFEVGPVVLVAAAVLGDVVARTVVPLGGAVRPSFLAFCGVLVLAAALHGAGLRHSEASRVADVVVELGEGGQAGLRAELASLLGDPGLELGTWQGGEFVDEAGRVVRPPGPGGPRRAVTVARGEAPDLLVVHGASVWDEPVLRDAVERWAALSQANAWLRRQARQSVDDVAASRRRLLVAADVERERLGRRIDTSVTQPLHHLHEQLTGVAEAGLVRRRLESLLDRLDSTSRDLAPPALDLGLRTALEELVDEAPVPVTLEVDEPGADALPDGLDLAPEVRRAAYYVCAEALTNALKHAEASRVAIAVAQRDGRLSVEVTDDGRGGATPAGGSGLAGLQDRVAAVGGTLTTTSVPGAGSTVHADLPLRAP